MSPGWGSGCKCPQGCKLPWGLKTTDLHRNVEVKIFLIRATLAFFWREIEGNKFLDFTQQIRGLWERIDGFSALSLGWPNAVPVVNAAPVYFTEKYKDLASQGSLVRAVLEDTEWTIFMNIQSHPQCRMAGNASQTQQTQSSQTHQRWTQESISF